MIGINSFLYPVIFGNLITSVTVTQAVQSDLGITLSTGVSQWNDTTSNAKHYTQATGANQPTYGSTLLNGYSVLTFDGTNDSLSSTLVTPAPGTTPTWLGAVVRLISWTGNDCIFGDTQTGVNYPRTFDEFSSSPTVRGYSGTGKNATMTLGSWFFLQVYWSSSTSDFIKVGPTNVTGTSMGNSYVSTGRMIGSGAGTGYTPANIEIAMLMHTAGLPSAGEIARVAAGVTQKYGGSVGV